MPSIDHIRVQMNELREDHPRVLELGSATDGDPHVFSLMCLKFFYKSGRFENSDVYNHFTDGSGDGGIDAIIADIESDELIFIQDKFVQQIASAQEVVDMLTKMQQTVDRLKQNNTANLNSKVKRIYRTQKAHHDGENYTNRLTLFIGCNPGPEMMSRINQKVNSTDSLSDYEWSIFYKTEIQQEIIKQTEEVRHVAEGSVNIDHNAGIIEYKNNGLLVNVSAKSIKNLYHQFRNDGLFEQNYRYYIKNKKIDEGIIASLRSNDLGNFWFLNNGIIIGCDSFRQDGSNVKLYNFSIINGCQTATLVGEHFHGEQDFEIPCKIVASEDLNETEREEFISKIAEASNSQKPIKERDLRSNKKEMRNLQKHLKAEDPKIYMKIKRGEDLGLTSSRARQLESYQKIDNLYYGKIVLSALLQRPGTARNAPATIFKTEEVYRQIFRRSDDLFDKDTTIDILRLYSHYSDFKNNELDNRINENQVNYKNVANNGEMLIPALVVFLIKVNREIVSIDQIPNQEIITNEIARDNLTGKLLKTPLIDTFENDLNDLFFDLVELIVEIFENREAELLNVTNFLKSDQKYWDIIIPKVKTHFYGNSRRRSQLTTLLSDLFI